MKAKKYVTHNEQEIKSCGTSFKGYLFATFETLKKVFGAPSEGDGYKIDAHWEVEFEDGTVATIYNWKNGVNYCGVEGQHLKHIVDWHIGGHSMNAEQEVKAAIRSYLDWIKNYEQCDGECASRHKHKDLIKLENLTICKDCFNNFKF